MSDEKKTRSRGRKRVQRCDDMAAKVAGGMTYKQVADEYKVTPVAVYKVCKRRGVVSVRSRFHPNNLKKAELKNEVGTEQDGYVGAEPQPFEPNDGYGFTRREHEPA